MKRTLYTLARGSSHYSARALKHEHHALFDRNGRTVTRPEDENDNTASISRHLTAGNRVHDAANSAVEGLGKLG